MENERDVSQVLMNVKGATGGIVSTALFSARISITIVIFLMRLAKKGMVAAGLADGFKEFSKNSAGKFTVYNVPLAADKAEKLGKLNQLELKLQNETSKREKVSIRKEIKQLTGELPELEQLKKLGIHHSVLPKLNGSSQTIQIAVAEKSDQLFKNWFLNHLTSELTGGEKSMEDLKVFTENNVTLFNLPFEGEEFQTALADFDTLGMNYSILPDLKIGDGNSQISIPNADRSKLEVWFKMWRDKQLREGKKPGEMYAMEQNSYMNTGMTDAGEYVAGSEQIYQDANAEFEEQSKKVPWSAGMGKENSEEYVRFLQNSGYERITINKATLVDKFEVTAKVAEMRTNGYFVSRVPGTYGDTEKTLIIPTNQVFLADGGKTYLAFLPKNQNTMIADRSGAIAQHPFYEVYAAYDVVNRNMRKVETLKKGIPLTKAKDLTKTPVPQIPKL